MAVLSFGIFSIIAFTPLSGVWFSNVSGLAPELVEFSRVPLMVMVVVPPLALFMCWKRSLCVVYKRTIYVTWATIIEVAATILLLMAGLSWGEVNGALAACFAMAAGRTVGALYLGFFGPREFLQKNN